MSYREESLLQVVCLHSVECYNRFVP